ncbi:uncharacterized mitochondrial protein-like protein [Tanacetum coccineum]
MSSEEEPKVVRKNDDAPIIEDWVSDNEEENVSQTKTKKKIVKPSIAKIEFVKPKQQEKTARKTVKHRQNTHSSRGNQRNWNNMMSQRLGSNFEMFNKACYVCGSFDHLQVDCNYHQKQFQNQRMVKVVWNNAQRIQLSDGLGPQKKLIFLSNVQDYEEIDGGYVAFEGNPKGGKITGKDPKSSHDDESKPSSDDGKKVDEDPRKESECNDQEKEDNVNNTNNVNAASTNEVNAVGGKTSIELPFDPNMPALEDYRDDEDDGAEADMNNLDTTIQVSPIPTIRIHKDHPLDQVIGDLQSATQTRKMSKNLEEHGKNPKSAFLYGKIEEEVVCICPTTGSKDPDFPDRVYKVEKALYGLHQAPRAWYETLSTYLLDNGFQRGKIDKTLFIKRHKGDILLVQVYVDDIIFGSTKKELCNAFEKLMHEKFQMSSIGELTFFLGLQVQQKKDGIFISQDKYVDEILKKFGFTEVKTASTPMETQSLCSRIKMVNQNGAFGILHILFDLVAYTDSDYARASLDRKSTTEGCQFLGCRLISWQCKKQTVVKTINGEVQLHALVDGKKIIINESTVRRDLQLEDAEGIDCLPNSTIFEELTRMGAKTTAWNEFSSTMASAIICLATNQKFNFSKYIFKSMVRNLDNVSGKFLMYPRKPKRKDTQVPQPSGPTDIVADEAVHKELGDSLVRAATTASSLEAEQDSGGGLRGNTLRSGEDSLKLTELMELCTNLQTRVLDLEKTKTTQANEIDSLKRRVKKLEKKISSRTHKLKRLYKVGLSARVESSRDEDSLGEDASKQGRRINVIDADEDITLVNVQDDAEMFDVNTLTALKSVKPKVKGVVIQEPSTTTITISSQQPSHDKEIALKLQAEIDKKERIARDEEENINEANIAWDDIQAKVDADYQLAERLQAEEQEQFTIEQKATLFKELLEKRRKYFAAKRA